MKNFRIGQYHVTRMQEMLTPGFTPDILFAEFEPGIFDEHKLLSGARFLVEASSKLMSSMHSWMTCDDKHTILVDTGCGHWQSPEGQLPMPENMAVIADSVLPVIEAGQAEITSLHCPKASSRCTSPGRRQLANWPRLPNAVGHAA